VGAPVSVQLQAVGGVAPYAWSVSGGALPAGLSLSTGGRLGGAPQASGDFDVGVSVQGSGGSSVEKSFLLTVSPASLAITTTALPSAAQGEGYAQALAAVGGTPPYTWTLSLARCGPTLPPGLGLDRASGLISGTPSSRGTYGFVAHVSDAAAASANRALSVTVN
jgi:hypothetical protein